MAQRLSRRTFGKAAVAGSLGYFLTSPAWTAAKVYGANDKLRFAGIGIGGKGSSDIDQAVELGECVALCDIDEKSLDKKAAKWNSVKVFHDYRKLLEDAIMKNVDAVTVSTPDHNHALASVMAMKQGKHVYCQKPLTHTVLEARIMREVAKANKVCTQMGNQGTSENGLRRAVELVQTGVLGDVTEVHCWTNRPVWPQAPVVTERPPESPCPKHIHWDEFIGTAPMRPWAKYDEKISKRQGAYHDFNWRGWWDFGTGAIGDMACHTANMAFMACKLTLPSHVQAEAGGVNPETCSAYAHVTMQFPARDGLKPVTLHWYEGKKDGKLLAPPDEWVKKALAIDPDPKRNKTLVNSGTIIIGTQGYIYSPNDYGAKVFIGPGESFKNVQTRVPEKIVPESVGHDDFDHRQKMEWVKAIREGKPSIALSNFDYASLLTESFLLGNVAIRSGKAFTYDGATGTITDAPEASKYLTVEYRKGWDMLKGS
jgi:predicted dehydrogenase